MTINFQPIRIVIVFLVINGTSGDLRSLKKAFFFARPNNPWAPLRAGFGRGTRVPLVI